MHQCFYISMLFCFKVNIFHLLYSCRCTNVIEGITSDLQEETEGLQFYDDGSEGAKIYIMMETAEDPEYLMADMSYEQLTSFSAYKAKLKVVLHSCFKGNLCEKKF